MSTLNLNSLNLRQMIAADLPAVIQVQASAYEQAFQESFSVFLRKFELAPRFCWIAEIQGQVVGYLFSHPWQGPLPPALHSDLNELPESTPCWFVHDMAFIPQARGLGLAKRLYKTACLSAKKWGFSFSMLVAMPGVSDFWRRCGYERVTSLTDLQQQKMAQYGEGACLMHLEVVK